MTESGYFTEGLVEWFHRELLKLCEKERGDEEIERVLRREVERMEGEIQHYTARKGLEPQLHYWGILLWDNRFWLFAKGECRGYLINKRFNKKNLRELGRCDKERQTLYRQGKVQRRLGILLCMPSFLSHLSKEELVEVLSVEGEASEERMQKRLQELWQENVRRGENGAAGAVYIRT